MATLRIPTPLRTYTSGQSEVQIQGKTVQEGMDDLTKQYPAIRQHLFTDQGQLRTFVNLYLNEEDIRQLQGASTPLNESDRLVLIPSIAGGKE